MKVDLIKNQFICNGKTLTKFLYSYKDENNKKITRVCKGCNTEEQAQSYINHLISIIEKKENIFLVKNIAKDMFIPGSLHLKRCKMFGKNYCEKTLNQKRQIIELIIKDFGDKDISKLKSIEVEKKLLSDNKHSGSWKNFYIETFHSIFEETKWKCKREIPKLNIHKFTRNSRKPDIFSTEELTTLFQPSNWEDKNIYLLFLLIANTGLRLGEAIALKVYQIDYTNHALIIDGFCKRDGTKTNYCKTGSPTDSKIRVTLLSKELEKLLTKYIEIHNKSSDDFIFTFNGRPYPQDKVRKVFKKQIRIAGIDITNRKYCPHSLRFTYVTRMRRNESVEQVQKLVGHSSALMTEYYTKAEIPEMIAAVKNARSSVEQLFED